VSHFVMNHAQKMIKARRAVPHNIEAMDAEGEAARSATGAEAYELNVQQFCCEGLNFGYYYEGSPIIAHEEEAAPAYSMGAFTPSTLPGCRTPHFWLDNGTSLYDLLGKGYSLLRMDDTVEVQGFLDQAKAHKVPMTFVDLAKQTHLPEAYQHKLILCRTDQHVVWRGNTLPDSPEDLMALLKGQATAMA